MSVLAERNPPVPKWWINFLVKISQRLLNINCTWKDRRVHRPEKFKSTSQMKKNPDTYQYKRDVFIINYTGENVLKDLNSWQGNHLLH